MAAPLPSIRIGICGTEESSAPAKRARGIWPVGYPGIVTAAGATPVVLERPTGRRTWADALRDVHGVVFAGSPAGAPGSYADE